MRVADAEFRLPIPGHPGRFELRQDPTRTSFKNGFIAHAFVGVTIEAFMHVFGSRALGVEVYASIEEKPLEDRVRRLGIIDPQILEDCRRYRTSRREFVHERALRPRPEEVQFRVVQDEADHAIELMHRLEGALRSKFPAT